jgi:hypothetical protein
MATHALGATRETQVCAVSLGCKGVSMRVRTTKDIIINDDVLYILYIISII